MVVAESFPALFFSEAVQPVPLRIPVEPVPGDHTKYQILGWGLDSTQGERTDLLMHIDNLPLISDDACRSLGFAFDTASVMCVNTFHGESPCRVSLALGSNDEQCSNAH